MVTPKNFKCTKCGECCRPIVKVDKKDIKRIEELGLTDFTEYDQKIRSRVLKQNKGVCVFLKREGDEFTCSIHNNRPEVCRNYPFIEVEEVEDCRPKGWEKWMKLKDVIE